jgi:hypothetical protein
VDAVAKNALVNEAFVSFDNAKGERVTGQYLVVVEFDPELHKVIGERMYMDPVFGQMWVENLGEGFTELPGVSKVTDSAPVIDAANAHAMAAPAES